MQLMKLIRLYVGSTCLCFYVNGKCSFQCKELYYCVKEAMERAAARGAGLAGAPGTNMELGGAVKF